ncbi:hypothetical protein SAMN05421743_105239 [Thalassobacillus cyri]|uniref:Uncharacterized protein n=1 Tax=Thalassobacillus cyri TaxID=571932 RepID=A0A1H4C2H7_9BACI|nr:hypothetical protein [Thalassobacillus cyri]SEA54579.1 hypothetical protein SAMN05421743_105239 [Thalassobacillus cyri]
MKYIYNHLIGALISTAIYLSFIFMYGMIQDGSFDLISLPFIFLFAFPIYLLVANPITRIISHFLQKYTGNLLLFLIPILTIISFLIHYAFSINNSIEKVSLSEFNTLFTVFYCLITAIPSILGVEYVEK